MRKITKIGVPALLIAVVSLVVLVTQTNAVRSLNTRIVTKSAKGIVTDSQDRPIAGATVYFIDTSLIDLTPITKTDMTTIVVGATATKAEAYDEPLEDVLRNPAKLPLLPSAITDSKGKFAVKKLNVAAMYLAFVKPATADKDHIPGGDMTRIPFAPKKISSKGMHIHMSWSNLPPDLTLPDAEGNATYIGTTACYSCHDGTVASDQRGTKKHIHSMMFVKPGQLTANQDSSNYPNLGQFLAKFTDVSTLTPSDFSASGVKALFFDTFDAAQAQKWLIWEDTDITTTQQTAAALKLFLWKKNVAVSPAPAQYKYFVTFKNQANPSDANNYYTCEVAMTMGAYLRQRLLLKLPGSLQPPGTTTPLPTVPPAPLASYDGAYQFITFQGFNISSQGRNTNYFADRSRRVYQEGGPGGGTFTSTTSSPSLWYKYSATTPAAATIVVAVPTSATPAPAHPSGGATNCAVCHMGGNTTRKATNPLTGEIQSHTVSDPNGVYDSRTGNPDDYGINCETCHGPGSKHRDAANATSDAVVAKGQPKPKNAKYIVNPKFLGSDRSALLCGRCHSGGSGVTEDNNFALPGTSRADWISVYTNPTGTTPGNIARGTMWPDNIHERGGHEGLTYSTFIRGAHYVNARRLVTCTDCHGLHGEAPYRRAMLYDPDDAASPLCQRCHERDVTQHVIDKTGSAMNGSAINCNQCHMAKTGKGGAGQPGLILATPNGTATDANIIYWKNDQTSHLMDMPGKFSRGTAGVSPPGSIPYTSNPILGAMPVPYTNACGTCHDASKLQFQQPQQ